MSVIGTAGNVLGVHIEDTKLYQDVENKLEASDPLVKLALVGVIIVAIYLIIQPSRTARLAGALWFVMP